MSIQRVLFATAFLNGVKVDEDDVRFVVCSSCGEVMLLERANENNNRHVVG